MAAKTIPVHTIIPRFTTENRCGVWYMSVLEAGILAVSGYNGRTMETFINLFKFVMDPDSHEYPSLMTSQPFFSKDFSSSVSSSSRSVCVLDDYRCVTSCGNTIESYDTKSGGLVHQATFDGEARCMATRDGSVYVGLDSNKVVVFNVRLNTIQILTLKGLKVEEWPRDITVSNQTLFICTSVDYRRALMCNSEGDIEHEYTNQQYNYAKSITVCEETGLVFILWGDVVCTRIVVVYSLLSRRHSSISDGGYSSLSGPSYILASFEVPDGSKRIRINSNINRLFVVTQRTGEIYEYHTSDIFFDNLLASMEALSREGDIEKLLEYFVIPANVAKTITCTDSPISSLVGHLRETGVISLEDTSHLLTACSDQGLSQLLTVLTLYQDFHNSVVTKRLSSNQQEIKQLTDTLRISEDEIEQLTERLRATEEERQELTRKLETKEKERQEVKDLLRGNEKTLRSYESKFIAMKNERKQLLQGQTRLVEENQHLKEELEETKSSFRATNEELVQYQLKYTKESMSLKEVPSQTRTALSKYESGSSASVTNGLHESALAADYDRLMVNVAEDLTLDSVLKLATLFGLPPAETDMLRRISQVETPGISLLKFINKRNIISMYDVTNLQKGVMFIQLNRTNTNLLDPYQSTLDPFLFEENQSPKLLDWPETKLQDIASEGTIPHHATGERENRSGEGHGYDDESLMEKTENGVLPNPRQNSQKLQMRHHHQYIEHKVNVDGGTISIAGVNLTIPAKAFSGDHVIAVTVINDPDIHLPGSARRGRMTPLVKLEPEGLEFKIPAQLTVPHSAIIPEPDRHDACIYKGQRDKGNLQQGKITWAEEKSIGWKLEQEKISLDINTLSYIFVNLVSHETEQKHIFRVVPFIDGILHTNDDVLITVCFCKDSDEEYKSLVKDHQSKLCLGNDTTFQISRTLTDGRDEPSYVNLTMSSLTEGYRLTKEESTKHVDIDHLCAACRVSHQFRLKRNLNGDIDRIDVKLHVSQNERNQEALILRSKIKDILLSPESQQILFRGLRPDLRTYEELKQDVSKRLGKEHCGKLCVYFELTPVENEVVQSTTESGEMLMKILDEREIILPDKMIGLYEGLKAIHFNKAASLVLNYIDRLKKNDTNEKEQYNWNTRGIQEMQEVTSKREIKLSGNLQLLVQEGYTRLDARRALKLSHGKLDLGRRLLSLAKEEHERLALFPGSNMYKEQYIDQHGGEVVIANVILRIPAGALHTGRIISLWVSVDPIIEGPISEKNLRLTPFVKFGPESLTLCKPVTLIIPHCGFTPCNQTGLVVYSGVFKTDKTVKWSREKKHFSCIMNSQHLQVEALKFCLVGLHIPYLPKLRKRVCVLPIMNRVSNAGDRLTIHLWFHNDDRLEYESLINEEIYQRKGIKLHDTVSVVLESTTSTLPVSISSSNSQCSPHPRRMDVAMETLRLQNRHKVVFQLRNKGIRETVDLKILARSRTRKILFQLNIQLKIEELLHSEPTTSPFQHKLPESIGTSFDQVKQELSEHLDTDQSTHLAAVLHLPHDVITAINTHKLPGTRLLEILTEKSVISPTNVTKLENALTEQRNTKCAELVRNFRWKNPVVQATVCSD